jgi:glycosyltransferase involved in cell wall biosynthesis
MTRQHRILLVADPYVPVPPVYYGGVERIVNFLAEGLKNRGWDVTLACHPDSTCQVKRLPLCQSGFYQYSRISNLVSVAREIFTGHYDLIHSFGHCDLTAIFWPSSRLQIQSFQAPPHPGALAKRMKLLPRKNMWLTTCGHHMVKNYQHFAPTRGIHNGVKIEDFTFQASVETDAPLVFLGRIEPIKGTHHAIHIARETGRRLIIAGNLSDNELSRGYFAREIQPHLTERIEFIGPVNDVQKNQLLGSAAAFLMPIEWDEPFGIVMAEALACGTPVIGTSRGALPEIVDHGITGACCSDIGEMIEAARDVAIFRRSECRRSAERYFSSDVIIEQYVALYQEILAS